MIFDSFFAEHMDLQSFMLWGGWFQIFAASFMKVVDESWVSIQIASVTVEENLVRLSSKSGWGFLTHWRGYNFIIQSRIVVFEDCKSYCSIPSATTAGCNIMLFMSIFWILPVKCFFFFCKNKNESIVLKGLVCIQKCQITLHNQTKVANQTIDL